MTERITHLLDGFIKLIGSTLVAAIFLITLCQVVLRYVFSIALPWSAEAAQVLMVYTVMLVAAYASGRGTHFTVTALLDRIPDRFLPFIRRIHSLLTLSFAIVALVYGTRLALAQMGAKLPALGIPVGVVYAALPFGALFMSVYALIGLFAPQRSDLGQIGN